MSGGSNRGGFEAVWEALRSADRIALTTHVNADGDGAGSEVAVASFLRRRGSDPTIVNPTPFPDVYRFLLGDLEVFDVGEPRGRRALEHADLVFVLDTSEASRLGTVAGMLEGRRVVVLDHHPPNPNALGDPAVRDPSACATGELVYDLLSLEDGDLLPLEARALYVAIVTDTGSFRFSNTSPRAHQIAARLLEAGVDPTDLYRRLYGQVTPGRLALLRRALASLRVDSEYPIAWVRLTQAEVEASGAAAADLDTEGMVEYPRRLRGIEVAVLFRELPGSRTKASLRSNGDVDVARVARALGGGGHAKAAGVLLDMPLEEGCRAVLEHLRAAMRS